MAQIVSGSIVQDVKTADVPWFTLLEDGTRDKTNMEFISNGVRYVKYGHAFENILAMPTTPGDSWMQSL